MASTGLGIDLSLPIEPALSQQLVTRVLEKLSRTGDCWLWAGGLRNGYGNISVHNWPTYVHELVWALAFGPIPRGRFVLHSCDTPACGRPLHLFLGSHADNMADASAKGRLKGRAHPRGETHPLATLKDEQVRQIRRRWSLGEAGQHELAREFDVSQSTIWRIVHGATR